MADNEGSDTTSSGRGGDTSEGRRLLHLQDKSSNDEDSEPHTGYGIVSAAVFVIATVAGTGVLVLPNALAKTGWSGLIVLITICVIQIYTGIILGRCWSILQERFEIYRRQTRNPYPAIGYEAFGTIGRAIVTVTVDVSVIGICVVFLIIISENAIILFGMENVNNCYILAVTAAILCPFTWLGTPKDFWFVGVAGTLSTGFACIMLLIKILRQVPTHFDYDIDYTAPSFISYFSGVGIMIVAFNGHMSFPIIQHDMADPSKFPRSLILAGIIISFYFLPLCTVGFYVYGDTLLQKENILDVVGSGFEPTAALLLITLHIFAAFLILGNPVFQDLEEIIGIETTFTWKRVATRSSCLLFIWFIAATIPSFSNILSILGGTSLLALAFIYPPCCYCKLKLTGTPTKSWILESFSILEVVTFSAILSLGVFISVSTTYADISIVGSELFLNFSRPCYLSLLNGS